MAEIAAICISDVRGIQKHEIPEAFLKKDWGIEGDAHAGNWHRQVSLLSVESVEKLQEKLSFELAHGAFAENILVKGMSVHTLPVGTRLRIGEALCEVTQIGKECHNDCAIKKTTGKCVMPTEGIFCEVVTPGRVQKGDRITVLEEMP